MSSHDETHLHRLDDDGGPAHDRETYLAREAAKQLQVEDGPEVFLVLSSSMTLDELTERVHDINVEKKWNDNRTVGDDIALLHSEASEMLEEHRDGVSPTVVYFDNDPDKTKFPLGDPSFDLVPYQPDMDGKPLGLAVEAADLQIRLVDFVKRRIGVENFEKALEIKLQYNATRPERHGGKVL